CSCLAASIGHRACFRRAEACADRADAGQPYSVGIETADGGCRSKAGRGLLHSTSGDRFDAACETVDAAVHQLMAALLWLRFEDRGGETILRLKQQQPPWRVIRGFPSGSGEALAHLHNVSGGVLDKDDLHLQVEVGAGARAQLTTTGATRVYR